MTQLQVGVCTSPANRVDRVTHNIIVHGSTTQFTAPAELASEQDA